MTYNGNSPQKIFITGRYTLAFLLAGAFLLWLFGWFVEIEGPIRSQLSIFYVDSDWLGRLLSFAMYVVVALILNSFVIIEGRTPWLGGIMMWLTGILFVIHDNVTLSLSLFMLVIALSCLFSCYQREGIERRLFAAFVSLGTCFIILPQFIYVAPLFLLYPLMTSTIGFKGGFASLLGLFTPFWLYFGFMLAFSQFDMAQQTFFSRWNHIIPFTFLELSAYNMTLLVIELSVMISATVLFMSNMTPAKPLMRKMFFFFILMNFYLWVVSIVKYQDSELLLVWRLPGLAVMMAYIFSLRITKLSNIYFVLLNVMTVVLALLGLWNG